VSLEGVEVGKWLSLWLLANLRWRMHASFIMSLELFDKEK